MARFEYIRHCKKLDIAQNLAQGLRTKSYTQDYQQYI